MNRLIPLLSLTLTWVSLTGCAAEVVPENPQEDVRNGIIYANEARRDACACPDYRESTFCMSAPRFSETDLDCAVSVVNANPDASFLCEAMEASTLLDCVTLAACDTAALDACTAEFGNCMTDERIAGCFR